METHCHPNCYSLKDGTVVHHPDCAPANLYVMAVDWTNGRTATYERHLAWRTDEASARKYFARNLINASGLRAALVAPNGAILETA